MFKITILAQTLAFARAGHLFSRRLGARQFRRRLQLPWVWIKWWRCSLLLPTVPTSASVRCWQGVLF